MKTTKKKVARRTQKPASQPLASAIPPSLAPVSATLSPQTSELVRWYCGITKHFEANTVEGAVYGVLTRAKDAYEGTRGMDEAFDWLMEDVLRAKNDYLREPLCRRYDGGYTVQLNAKASELLARYVRDGNDDPRDVVSGAVESMLRCVLSDGEVGFPEAARRAKRQRLADEAEKARRNQSMATYQSQKEVTA